MTTIFKQSEYTNFSFLKGNLLIVPPFEKGGLGGILYMMENK